MLLQLGDRAADERGLRLDQAGSGGAARSGRDLHGGHAAPDPVGGVAELGLPDARPQAVLRGHVLPAPRRHGPAGLPPRADRSARSLGAPPDRGPAAGRGHRRGDAGAPRGRGGRSGPGPLVGQRRPGCAGRPVRSHVGRLYPGPEVPLSRQPLLPARPGRGRGSPEDAGGHPRPNGERRDAGPARGRLPPLFHRRRLAGPPFREDALRQRLPGLPLRGSGPPLSRSGLCRGGPGHPRLRPRRVERARGRLPVGHRRRDGRPRGGVLHLDGRGTARSPGLRRPCAARFGLRLRRPPQLRRRALRASPARAAGRAGAGGRAERGGPGSTARAGPPGSPGGARQASAAPRRRQGADRLEWSHDRGHGPGGRGAGGGPLPGCRAAGRRVPPREARRSRLWYPAPRLARRAGARGRLPGRLRVLHLRAAAAARRHRRGAMATGGGAAPGRAGEPARRPRVRRLLHGGRGQERALPRQACLRWGRALGQRRRGLEPAGAGRPNRRGRLPRAGGSGPGRVR